MNKASIFLLACYLFANSCTAQQFGQGHLALDKKIRLLNVRGRIDHMDYNLKDQVVYVSALGNNSLEVADLQQGKVIHSIKGLHEPQGVGYIPQTEEIFVANGGNGDCYFFNSKTFEKTATVHLASDADDVRYDSIDKKIYVGYGEGGIAIIDPIRHQQTGDIKLPAHPEGFQLDKSLNKLFVNLPDVHLIGVVDLAQFKLVAKWNTSGLRANFPMAIDTINHRLFIGNRTPPTLVILNEKTGEQITSLNMVGDSDDLYYDAAKKEVIISGGEGFVDIFFEESLNAFKQISNVATRPRARTSLLISNLNIFIVAERAEGGEEALLLVFKI